MSTYSLSPEYCMHRAYFFGIPGPQCLNPPTIEVDGKGFCPEHAEEHRV